MQWRSKPGLLAFSATISLFDHPFNPRWMGDRVKRLNAGNNLILSAAWGCPAQFPPALWVTDQQLPAADLCRAPVQSGVLCAVESTAQTTSAVPPTPPEDT